MKENESSYKEEPMATINTRNMVNIKKVEILPKT